MPELDWITVKGFKSIGCIERLELRAINLLIGANGSGKSNFIGVFSFLQAIRDKRLRDYVGRAGGADRLLHFGSKRTDSLTVHVSFNNGVTQYKIELVATDADELNPTSEVVYFWNKEHERPHETSIRGYKGEAAIGDHSKGGVAKYVRSHLGRWRLYHFHDTSSSSPLKKPADLHDNSYLRPDGANLPAFLYYLRKKQETSYDLIRDSVELAAPFFEDFQLKPLALNENKIRLEWRHRGSDAYFDASSLSDGSLRFIALATLLLQPAKLRPSVILLDEPELGLHPYAITLLASLVKQAAVDTQIVIATQSPLLLDHFEPEDVLVAERVNGHTEFSRLDSERLKHWLEDYSLGQLWEKNELGGRPTPEIDRRLY